MRITLLGAGNVAQHLGFGLFQCGFDIVQVYSRQLEHALALAAQLKARPCNELSLIEGGADVYLFMLRDDALIALADSLHVEGGLFIHTSGTVGLEVFANHSANSVAGSGVLYPLQSFSAGAAVDLGVVPLFVEASSASALVAVEKLGNALSRKVTVINSATRKHLHLAAVFASNFTNHLFTIAADILYEKNLPFEVLELLIRNTVDKALSLSPVQAQTGPAFRRDQNVISTQLKMLGGDRDVKAVYEAITASIMKKFAK